MTHVEFSAVEAERDEAQARVSELEWEIQSLQEQVQRRDVKLGEAKTTLLAKEEECDTVRAKATEHSERWQKAEGEVKDMTRKVERLTELLATVRDNLDGTRKDKPTKGQLDQAAKTAIGQINAELRDR